jgi:glutamate-5-semialdehyde dehydrogenase
MATTVKSVAESAAAAKQASRQLVAASTAVKDSALRRTAELLGERSSEVLEANAADLADERASGLSSSLRDRLTLNEERVRAMATGVSEIVSLPDPVGEEIEARTIASGIELRRVRVPLGVVAVVYEARPNVTIDCAALTIKSGNALVLRGSSYAERSNGALAAIVREGLADAGLPEDAVVMLPGGSRADLAELATQDELIDLLIPRGGAGLKEALKEVATVPVIYAAAGNCHVYVHDDADLEMARRVAFDAKVDRPGVCNSAETLLVNSTVAAAFLPGILGDLQAAGVELVGDERVRENAGDVEVAAASAEDWDTEYLDMKIAVAVVDSEQEAIDHINRHGTGHSEAIITSSEQAGEEFSTGVDAAAVYINASTRFTDGFEYGMGAEIGNSTQKLHARGPVGLRELTTYKYVARGDGQTRG